MRDLRPSILPKIAACPSFEGKPGEAGPAAQRGTKLDAAFRIGWETGRIPDDLEFADLEAVKWAIREVSELISNRFVTEEPACKIKIPGLAKEGTADGIDVSTLSLVDLKSGEIRNYWEQMAAYAYGLMIKHLADFWICHLVFCDQRQVKTRVFSFNEAKALTEEMIRRGTDPERVPTVCEYCSWCAKSETCGVRLKQLETVVETTSDQFVTILNNPALLGEFLKQAKTAEKLIAKAEEQAKTLLAAGQVVPGWRLSTGATMESVPLKEFADRIELERILDQIPPLTGKRAREIWRTYNAPEAFPEEIITKKEKAASLQPTKN